MLRATPGDAHDDERERPARPVGLERRHDHDAHREEGEAVAASLPRDVEQERRDRGEEEDTAAPARAPIRRWSQAVTSATPTTNGTADQSR